MKGTKRLGVTDSNPESNDSFSQSKKVLVGSEFDIHRAEPSQKKPMEAPSLDMRRAELTRQHVRALNSQFASWVQTQLQNHPDELWEDGVQDYINHASNIMVKFSDVVDWLMAKSAAENSSALENQTAPKKLLKDSNKNSFFGIPPASTTASFAVSWSNPNQKNNVSEGKDNNEIKTILEKPGLAPFGNSAGFPVSWGNPVQNKLLTESKDTNQKESLEKTGSGPAAVSSAFGMTWGGPVPNKLASEDNNSNGIKKFSEKPGINPASTTTGFGMPWSSAPIFGSQTSFSFGNQNSAPVNHNVPNDTEGGDDDVEQPSSPSVKKSEEKGITVVHEMKCKLYVKSTDPADKDSWKDKGTGQLSIKCQEGVSKGTKESKPTIIVRNDVGRILLNALLYPGIKTNLQKNSIVAIFHTSEDDNNVNVVARTFLIRAKTEDDRNKLASAIKEYAPAA
ncbi:Pleckstrin domain superfamily protein [Heracleum sosnowskyi]|uniref:Pleckstrin domain superfamily protein n=1 Tax=Heracleum sosnowskyi TaxID=360622 RepID=A0AAD8HXY3_9APIA|nr:Pleckstrin domain superfamily protein [Heracleum sosnowskyi]